MKLISTGLKFAVDDNLKDNMYLRIAPKSGLTLKGLTCLAGVVDTSYTEEIKVVIYNLFDK